jgi:hypothetical protein
VRLVWDLRKVDMVGGEDLFPVISEMDYLGPFSKIGKEHKASELIQV